VKKALKGGRRIESDRFIAFRSHYLFASRLIVLGLRCGCRGLVRWDLFCV
jgi:hypothetical protein